MEPSRDFDDLDTFGETDGPKGKRRKAHFEIARSISTTQLNREHDRRVQWCVSRQKWLSALLLASVIANVGQALAETEYLYLAQDIRTAQYTTLQPLPAQQRSTTAKVGPPPAYTSEFLARLDRQETERRAYLNSLYPSEKPAAAPSGLAAASAPN